jgi:AcrR family transcriptional regulator
MGIPERKEREKERRREEILDAAQRVFFDKGLNAATMDEISLAAELSKATIYLHFDSKEDLYLAVTMRGLRILHGTFNEIITNEPSVVMALHRIEKAYLEFFNTHRSYYRMMTFYQTPQLHKQVSDAMMAACGEEINRYWEMFIGLFARGMKEKKIRGDISPADLAIIIWSNTTILLMRIDNEYEAWKKRRDVDLHRTLEVSFRLTIDAILTPVAHREYEAILHNDPPATQQP